MKPPTIRQRVLAELRASPKPLLSCVVARRVGASRHTVQTALWRLRTGGAVVRAGSLRWRAYEPERASRASLAAVLVHVREVMCWRRTAQIAEAAGVSVSVALRALRELHRDGRIERKASRAQARGHRWRILGAPKPPPKPRYTVHALAALRASREPMSGEQIAEASGVPAREIVATMRRLVGRDAAVCIVDRATGARTWQAVRP